MSLGTIPRIVRLPVMAVLVVFLSAVFKRAVAYASREGVWVIGEPREDAAVFRRCIFDELAVIIETTNR